VDVQRYVVRKGDCLWRIAEAKLGHGREWPRIWRYNNQPSIVRMTGGSISDPDLIYPGQVLMLPILPNQPMKQPASTPVTHGYSAIATNQSTANRKFDASQPRVDSNGRPRSLKESLRDLRSPFSIKYRLEDVKLPPIVQPGFILEIKMIGDVLLRTHKSYPTTSFTQKKEIEAQLVTQANHAFGSLLTDTRFVFDSAKNTLTYRSMLVSESRLDRAPSVAVGIQVDSSSPMAKLRFEYRFPKLAGSLPVFQYTAFDVKVVVELTPTQLPGSDTLNRSLPERSPSMNWDRVIGTGLILLGSAIVIGTVIEDFWPVAGGPANDPASFAIAGMNLARGMQMVRGAAAILPAAAPAVIGFAIQLEHSAWPQGQTH